MHEILTKIRFSPSVPMIGDAYSEREHEHIYIGITLNTTACTDLRACGCAFYAGLQQRALNMCIHVWNMLNMCIHIEYMCTYTCTQCMTVPIWSPFAESCGLVPLENMVASDLSRSLSISM